MAFKVRVRGHVPGYATAIKCPCYTLRIDSLRYFKACLRNVRYFVAIQLVVLSQTTSLDHSQMTGIIRDKLTTKVSTFSRLLNVMWRQLCDTNVIMNTFRCFLLV